MRPKFIARQLSNPTGFVGYLVGQIMNRGNARMNSFAVKQLEIGPTDKVLEIGFGGGANLAALLASGAYVAGVDRSSDVVKLASSRYSRAVEENRAQFRVAAVESMPYDACYFTKVCTVNTIYFWKGFDESFHEIYRVMAPRGRLAVGFLPKYWMDRMNMPPDIFISRSSDEVARALIRAGFRNVRSALPETLQAWNVLIAER